MALCILVQAVGIDRFAVFDDHVGLLDLRHMCFPHISRVVQRDRHDRAAGLCGDLERAVAERQHAQLLAGISRPLGEQADGDAVLYIIDGLKDRFQPLLRILSVKEQTVEAAHPCGKRRNVLHFFLGDIAGQPSASAVGEQDVKIASVVSDEQDRLVGNILFSDDGRPDSGDLQYSLESPLYDTQGTDIPGIGIELADDPFDEENRDREDQIHDQKYYDTDKTKHGTALFFNNINK